MKRLVVATLTLLLALSLAACAEDTQSTSNAEGQQSGPVSSRYYPDHGASGRILSR